MFDDLHKSFDSRKVFLLFDVRLLLDVDCELAGTGFRKLQSFTPN